MFKAMGDKKLRWMVKLRRRIYRLGAVSPRYPTNDAEHTVLLLPTFEAELLELTWGKEVADRLQDQVPAPQSIQQLLGRRRFVTHGTT